MDCIVSFILSIKGIFLRNMKPEWLDILSNTLDEAQKAM